MGLQEVEIGLAADVGTLQILPKLITDHGLFRELVYTSRTFGTKEAQQLGLIRYRKSQVALIYQNDSIFKPFHLLHRNDMRYSIFHFVRGALEFHDIVLSYL